MADKSPPSFLQREERNIHIFLSSFVAVLMTGMSGLGLVLPDLFYPSPEIAEAFLTNDLVNIIIGLPFFLISLVFIKREKLVGALLLPGALIYVIYNYFAYLLGTPFTWSTLGYLILVILSGIALILLLRILNHSEVKRRLVGNVAEKFAGWVLVVFGLAFIGLALSEIIPGILDGSIPPLGEKAVSAADILVSLGWVAGGILLLRRSAAGYSLGLGLLMAASTLFIGLILYFFFAPALTGREFDWIEVLTVLVMGMICFVPASLYLRGINRSS